MMVGKSVTGTSEHLATVEKGRDLLPLENGDRLRRAEFERRYQAMPNLKKAELIEGVVYMASPLRFAPHAEPHGLVITWLGVYRSATPGVRLGIEPTVRLDMDNEPRPDGVLLLDETVGGQSRIDADGYVVGAPEFIAEVAASSAADDLGDKLRAYRRNGVREYLVWQVRDRRLDWFRLTEGEYVPLQADAEGVLRSDIFPGLWLAVPAFLEEDFAGVLAVLQEGLATSEHAAFVQQLRQR